MARRATHIPTGHEIDLDDPDDLFTQVILAESHRHCGRGDRGLLECREHDENGVVHGIWVYLQRRQGQWLLCHCDGSYEHRASGGMSIQHRWQQEYWQRAGEAAGYETLDLDRDDPRRFSGVRPDMVIIGPAAMIGVEVQRSGIAVESARERTRKAAEHGITSLWSTDLEIHPAWSYRVPHVETNLLPGRDTSRGSWTVTGGPRVVTGAKCNALNFDRCPETGGRQCGKDHPKFAPLTGLRVDDVAERAPAGDLVPINVRQGRRKLTYLVSADHKRLYDELVAGWVTRDDVADGGDVERSTPFGPCRREVPPQLPTGPRCVDCGQRLLLIRPGRVQCEACRIAQARAGNDPDFLPGLWRRIARGYDH